VFRLYSLILPTCMHIVLSKQELILPLVLARSLPDLSNHLEELLIRPSLLNALAILRAGLHVVIGIVYLQQLRGRRLLHRLALPI
jgi:hypothetical protein